MLSIIVLSNVCHAIIVNDDRQDVSQYQGNYYTQTDSYEDYEDDYTKRRHKKRRRPCPSNKVAPDGKTLVNIYYSDVNVVESTHHYQGGVSYGCGPGITSPDNNQVFGSRPPINNRPGLLHNTNRPGLLQFLNNVLFGDSKPFDNSLAVTAEDEISSDSETGPLGGTVPNKIRVTAYNNNYNIRRAYKEFNRELDSFLRPFYRLF